MKLKKLFAPILATVMSLAMVGCKQKNSDASVKYVSSCYPVHIIMMNLVDGIGNVEVTKMSQTHTGCLHDFQLQSQDLKNIEQSSAFIVNGAGMENFLDKVKEENPKIKIIDSGENIDLISDCSEHDHDDCDDELGHNHCHSCTNPHIWMSLDNYIIQIKNILEGLKSADPNNSEKYEKNAEIYIGKINDLKIRMHHELSSLSGKNIVTLHNSFPYFAREFNFNILAVINNDSDEEPSSKEISNIINIAKENNVASIFAEPQYSDNLAKIVSREASVPIHTIDTCVTGDDSKNAYINAMEENLKILKTAFNQ